MNIQQLEYIVALDEHRHFVTAAEHCHVTQPTLTMQLKKLEEELGIQLFDRTKKPLKPTPGGEVFIAKARRILMDIDDLHASVAGEKSGIKGEFRLGIIPTLAPHLLPLFLGHFVENNPETILRIEEMESEYIIKALHENRLDVAIMATPTDERNFKETVLFNEAFLFYAPIGHPLLNTEEIEADKLDVSGMLLLSDGHCFRNQALKICNKGSNESNFQFHYQSGSIETLKGLVRKGIGYTLVPELAVNGVDKEFMRRFKSPEPVREVSLVTHTSFSRTLLIEKLKTSIRETLPKHIEAPKEFVKIKWR
ncbi:hydrogen peroxide-inducible genes activator [Alkalitalea saponilacus]|uniref:LysR family transcriptional regulator, hydrogen peroxide-inducible genes activator n=1 Tax=Alkalitalea saponilacus TaxID=889453 RepID=A0A1T5AW87_9BACT|nr:hydrogen peroxide-inducible genes activator [Alkalitalea saponilacus]ASB48573.1 LysR family transcriptional regulator [Alkalitalea saponilacus]SKB39226.1 LysR family transcriptional regulator, hydrogen peroxide-inducible genes activator [Alkalitalea saponilacus]